MRAVLDTNVLVSAILSRDGSPAAVLRAWLEGRFELVASPRLLDELSRVLAYPKLRAHVDAGDAADFVRWIRDRAIVTDDPVGDPPFRSIYPGDDYLISLAAVARAVIDTGDGDLLAMGEHLPVVTATGFLQTLSRV